MVDSVSITVRVTDGTRPGITAVRTSVARLTRDASAAGDAFGSLRANALSLAPALLPIAAATAPIAVGLGAATLAMGVFAAAAGQQVVKVLAASEAQSAYADAVEEHGAASKQAAQADVAFQRELEKLPAASRQVVAAFSSMKGQYEDWSDSLADDTMPVFRHSLELLSSAFPKLTPTVQASSRELDRFVALANAGVNSRGFDSFMDRFDDFAEQSMYRARVGLLQFIETAQTNGVGADVEQFMDYARTHAPAVGDTLMGVTEALTNLLIGASDVGVSMLGVVNGFVNLAAAVPPDLISALLQSYAALRLVRLGIAGVTAVASSRAVAGLVAFGTAARMQGVSAAMAGVTARMTGMQKAMLGLGGLALVAVGISELAEEARGAPPDVDRLTTSLRKLANTGEFSGELEATFGSVDGLVGKIGDLQQATEDANRTALGFRIPVLDDISDAIEGAVNDMVHGSDSLNALKDDFEAVDHALAGLATGGSADDAADAFRRIQEAAEAQGISLADLQDLFPEYQSAMDAVAAEQEAVARGMGLFGEQALRTQESLAEQQASADGLRQAIQALNDVQRAGLGGMIGFEAAIDAVAEAAADGAGSLEMVDGRLNLNSEASRTAAQALSDLAASTDEAAGSARDNGESWSYVNGIYERGRQKLVDAAQQMGLTREEAAALADQILATPDKTALLRGNLDDLEQKLEDARRGLRSVPDSRRAIVRAKIDQLQERLRAARRDLESVRDRSVSLTVTRYERTYRYAAVAAGRAASGLATGGIVGAAGGGPRSRRTLVGEQGPEIVDLPAGSRVRSNPDTMRLLGGGGSGAGYGPIQVNVVLDGRVLASGLVDPLRYEIRGRGGDVQQVLGQRR